MIFTTFESCKVLDYTKKRKDGVIIKNEKVKTCPRFKKERFETVEECPHITDSTHESSNHELVDPSSKLYQLILAAASKTTFMNDLGKMKFGNMTAFAENFHSVVIK